MGKGVSLQEMMNLLPDDERHAVEERATELIAEERTLRDLRKAMGKTQVDVAHKLGVKQGTVSRIEQQADMLLSTLNNYVGAIGGKVRVVAELPGRPPVAIGSLADIASTSRSNFVKHGRVTTMAAETVPRSHTTSSATSSARANRGSKVR